MSLIEYRVRELASDIFGVPANDITLSSSADNVKNWDSIGHLNLMLVVEETFGVRCSPEYVAKMMSIASIVEFLRGRMEEV